MDISSWESDFGLRLQTRIQVGLGDHQFKNEVLANNSVPLIYSLPQPPQKINLVCFGARTVDFSTPEQSDDVLISRMLDAKLLGSYLLSYDRDGAFESKTWDKCSCGMDVLNITHINSTMEEPLLMSIFGNFVEHGPFVVSLFNSPYIGPQAVNCRRTSEDPVVQESYDETHKEIVFFFKMLKMLTLAPNFKGMLVGHTVPDSPMCLYI